MDTTLLISAATGSARTDLPRLALHGPVTDVGINHPHLGLTKAPPLFTSAMTRSAWWRW